MTDTPPAGCTHAICLPLAGDGCQLDQTAATPDTAAVLAATWTAVPNDEIGGWAVSVDGRTPAAGGVMAADMMWSREIAEHIADLHNQHEVDAIRRLQRERDAFREVARSNQRHNAVLVELVERVQAFVDELPAVHAERLRGLLCAPTSAERAGVAPEPTLNPAQATTAGRNNTEEQP